jgi:prepilin-type N-terminal cleavage/methylation domain-containing protein
MNAIGPHAQQRAMTLIEVLIAVTLLSVAMAGVLFSFRTALTTFESGIRQGEGTLTARAAMALLMDDLRNIHYLPENRYNVTYRQRQAIVEQRAREAAATGREYDPLLDPDAPDPGLAIDLSFRVDDGGKSDTISFVRHQTDRSMDDRLLFGLARVTWTLQNNQLMRTIEDVTAAPVDPEGNELQKMGESRSDRIAAGVSTLDFRMGYWFEDQWLLSDQWESRLNDHRNPIDEDDILSGQERNDVRQSVSLNGIQAEMNQQGLLFIPDNLPAWVEVTMEFQDRNNSGRTMTFRNVVQFPMAQETNFDQDLLRGANPRGPGNRGRRVNP